MFTTGPTTECAESFYRFIALEREWTASDDFEPESAELKLVFGAWDRLNRAAAVLKADRISGV